MVAYDADANGVRLVQTCAGVSGEGFASISTDRRSQLVYGFFCLPPETPAGVGRVQRTNLAASTTGVVQGVLEDNKSEPVNLAIFTLYGF